jgi:hypothetical protein
MLAPRPDLLDELDALGRMRHVIETVVVPRAEQLRRDFLDAAAAAVPSAGLTPAQAVAQRARVRAASEAAARSAATVLAHGEHAADLAAARHRRGIPACTGSIRDFLASARAPSPGQAPAGRLAEPPLADDIRALAWAALGGRLAAIFAAQAAAAAQRGRMDWLADIYGRAGLHGRVAECREELRDALAQALYRWGTAESASILSQAQALEAVSRRPGLTRHERRVEELTRQFLDGVAVTTRVAGMRPERAGEVIEQARRAARPAAAAAAVAVAVGELSDDLARPWPTTPGAPGGICGQLSAAHDAALAAAAAVAQRADARAWVAAFDASIQDALDGLDALIGRMAWVAFAASAAPGLACCLRSWDEAPDPAASSATMACLARCAVPAADLEAEVSEIAAALRTRLESSLSDGHR